MSLMGEDDAYSEIKSESAIAKDVESVLKSFETDCVPADGGNAPKPKTAEPGAYTNNRLYISNIPFSFKESDLRKLFQPFGEVVETLIVTNERGSKGFGFVSMDSVESCERARLKLHGIKILGRTIEVRKATTPPVKKRLSVASSCSTPASPRVQSQSRYRGAQKSTSEIAVRAVPQAQPLSNSMQNLVFPETPRVRHLSTSSQVSNSMILCAPCTPTMESLPTTPIPIPMPVGMSYPPMAMYSPLVQPQYIPTAPVPVSLPMMAPAPLFRVPTGMQWGPLTCYQAPHTTHDPSLNAFGLYLPAQLSTSPPTSLNNTLNGSLSKYFMHEQKIMDLVFDNTMNASQLFSFCADPPSYKTTNNSSYESQISSTKSDSSGSEDEFTKQRKRSASPSEDSNDTIPKVARSKSVPIHFSK